MELKKRVSADQYYASVAKEDKLAIKNLNNTEPINFIPTGSWVIDRLIGNGNGKNQSGGLPRGHIVEVFGDASCGKTSLGISACIEAQRLGLIPMWLDYERTFQKIMAKNMGLDISPNKFFFHEPDHFEHGMKLIDGALEYYPALIVIDSVSAMIPQTYLDRDADDPARIGELARLMSLFLGSLNKFISAYGICVLFINQLRSVIKANKYDQGPVEETSGGRAIKFYSSVRIKMKKGKVDFVKEKSIITGKLEDKPNNVNVKITIFKNKIDVPYYSAPVYIKFGEGFDNITSIIDLADNCGILRKTGAYFRFDSGDQTLFNVAGKENLRDFLEKNPQILETLSSCVKLKVDEEEKAEGATVVQELSEDTADSILNKMEKRPLPEKPDPMELKVTPEPKSEKAAPKGKKNAKG
jgi:recombination protein RecA